MQPKFILIGAIIILIAIVGIFYLGQITTPSVTVTEEQISLQYSGGIQGKCVNCNFPEGVTGREYHGPIANSLFEGKIIYQGKTIWSNITIERGFFGGELTGSYDQATFKGNVDGYLNATIHGTTQETETRVIPVFFDIPQSLLAIIVLVIILLFLHFTGTLSRLLERHPEPPITKDDAILARELKEWLWFNNSIKLRKILTNLPMPLHKPLHVKFVCELEGDDEYSQGETIAIMYNSRRKFFGLRRNQTETQVRSFLGERIVRKYGVKPEVPPTKPIEEKTEK